MAHPSIAPTTPTSRRASRVALIVLTAGVFLAMAAPAAAADPISSLVRPTATSGGSTPPTLDVRPEPTTGGTRVDIEPGGPPPASAPPAAFNLFRAEAFRYQDPNYYACTATSALVILNTIALNGNGGSGFRWVPRYSIAAVDSILAWERTHDTLEGGNGSDPHGWRNALNYYGWGTATLSSGSRVYDDFAYTSYDRAMKTAIRQLIRTHKPVGIVAWKGRHVQFITGYDGLKGNPFARDGAGRYTNDFTIDAVRLTDPLASDGWVNARIGYSTLGSTTNARLRFAPYAETDSPYDDPYTSGWIRARDEWHGRWIIVAPLR